jgi:hypothetical protein
LLCDVPIASECRTRLDVPARRAPRRRP